MKVFLKIMGMISRISGRAIFKKSAQVGENKKITMMISINAGNRVGMVKGKRSFSK